MLDELLSRWNPINCFGKETALHDLSQFPLQPNETLMQDSGGRFHRITVATPKSSLWAKFQYWIQRHLNKKGHLEAINNMLYSFQKMMGSFPLKNPSDLKKFKHQIETLKSLKNDYFFTRGLGDPAVIDMKLKIIEEQAYQLFVQNVKGDAIDREDQRRQNFEKFIFDSNALLCYFSKEAVKNIYAMRMLMVSTSDELKAGFQDSIGSIRFRIGLCHTLNHQINAIAEDNRGKFTIPELEETLNCFRTKLLDVIEKLISEVEVFVENLKINYFINPFQAEVSDLLLSLKIDPLKIKDSWINFKPLPSTLHHELEEIKKLVTK
jgi:hypothetical protein